jgi:ribokinase
VVIGSVNLDVVASVPHIPIPGETLTGTTLERFYGGKGANQAVSIARLNHPVRMIAKVGDDENGELLRRGLRRAGVDVRGLTTSPETPSGTALIFTDPAGQNSIVIIPGANGRLLPVDLASFENLINSAGIILLQLEIPLQTVIYVAEMGYRKNIPVMLDPAPARARPPARRGGRGGGRPPPPAPHPRPGSPLRRGTALPRPAPRHYQDGRTGRLPRHPRRPAPAYSCLQGARGGYDRCRRRF